MKKKIFASVMLALFGFLMAVTNVSASFQVGEVTAKTYDPAEIITSAITWAGAIAGIVGLGYLIFAGIKYITAGGDPAKVEAAQKQIISAIIGLAIVVLAYTLIRFAYFLLGAGEFGLGGLKPLEPTE